MYERLSLFDTTYPLNWSPLFAINCYIITITIIFLAVFQLCSLPAKCHWRHCRVGLLSRFADLGKGSYTYYFIKRHKAANPSHNDDVIKKCYISTVHELLSDCYKDIVFLDEVIKTRTPSPFVITCHHWVATMACAPPPWWCIVWMTLKMMMRGSWIYCCEFASSLQDECHYLVFSTNSSWCRFPDTSAFALALLLQLPSRFNCW